MKNRIISYITAVLMAVGLFAYALPFSANHAFAALPAGAVPISDQYDINREIKGGIRDRYFYLTNDIELLASSWTAPIENFNGTLDGQGYSITVPGSVGLFGVVGNSTYKNLGICLDSDVTYVTTSGSTRATGGMISVAGGSVTIEDCYVTGTGKVYADGGGEVVAGGLVGWTNSNITIKRSYATVGVETNSTGNSYAGGLVGWINGSGSVTIENCYATGNVVNYSNKTTGFFDAGGLVGSLLSTNAVANFKNCYATGDVTNTGGASLHSGGLVGCTAPNGSDSNPHNFTNCYRLDTQTITETGTAYDENNAGAPLTVAEMQDPASFTNWDFSTIWEFEPGVNNDFPVLHKHGSQVYTVTFGVSGGSGSVEATIDGMDISSGALAADSKDVVFTATPDPGYMIDSWTDNGAAVNGTDTSYTISGIAASHTVMVEFAFIPTPPDDPEVISVTVDPDAATVLTGESQLFEAIVDTAYGAPDTVAWSVSGNTSAMTIIVDGLLTVAGDETAATLTVTATSTYDAGKSGAAVVTVEQTQYPAIYMLTVNGSYAPASGAGSFAQGDPITISAGVRSGYSFNGWTVVSGGASLDDASSATANFSMPASDVEVSANWTSTGGGDYNGGGGYDDGGYDGGSSYDGGSGAAPPAQTTVPANDGTAAVNYTQSGSNVTLTMPTNKVNEIIEAAKNDTATLDLSKVAGATSAAIPAAALQNLANAGLGVEIKLPQGTVTFDADAAKSAAQASGANISLSLSLPSVLSLPIEQRSAVKGSDVVFSITVASGSQSITSFNGTLTVNVPYNGPLPAAVWHLDNAGNLTKMDSSYDPVTKTVTFTTDHLSLYVVGQNPNPFTDIEESGWYYDAVQYIYGNGLMIGITGNEFAPEMELSRAMIVTILYRMADEPEISAEVIVRNAQFNDVVAGAWYADAVAWAYENGIVQGYGNGLFGTNDPVTKEQLAALIYRTQQSSGKAPMDILMDYEWQDWDAISGWAKSVVTKLTMQGLFRDIPGAALNPQAPAARAEIASMLYRYITAIE